jgi:hypothetical protein
MKNHEDSWARFLDPEWLRPALTWMSLFLFAYQMLEDILINRIKELYLDHNHYFTPSVKGHKKIRKDEYKREVKALARKGKSSGTLDGSIIWHRNREILDDKDVEIIDGLTKCRFSIAHKISSFIDEGDQYNLQSQFQKVLTLIDKIEKWWVLNYELTIIDTDFDLEDVNEESIYVGSTIGLKILHLVALGDQDQSHRLYNQYIKPTQGTIN